METASLRPPWIGQAARSCVHIDRLLARRNNTVPLAGSVAAMPSGPHSVCAGISLRNFQTPLRTGGFEVSRVFSNCARWVMSSPWSASQSAGRSKRRLRPCPSPSGRPSRADGERVIDRVHAARPHGGGQPGESGIEREAAVCLLIRHVAAELIQDPLVGEIATLLGAAGQDVGRGGRKKSRSDRQARCGRSGLHYDCLRDEWWPSAWRCTGVAVVTQGMSWRGSVRHPVVLEKGDGTTMDR